jgi:hypothetical protein
MAIWLDGEQPLDISWDDWTDFNAKVRSYSVLFVEKN